MEGREYSRPVVRANENRRDTARGFNGGAGIFPPGADQPEVRILGAGRFNGGAGIFPPGDVDALAIDGESPSFNGGAGIFPPGA